MRFYFTLYVSGAGLMACWFDEGRGMYCAPREDEREFSAASIADLYRQIEAAYSDTLPF
jgi:hypothetical protein